MGAATYSWVSLGLSLLMLVGVALPVVWVLLVVRDRTRVELRRWRLAFQQAQADWQQRWRDRAAELDIANEVLKAEVQHRVRVEKQFEQCRRQKWATARDRQEWADRLGREVQLPLTSVLGLLNVLGDSGLTPNQGELVQLARGRAQLLLKQINNLVGETAPDRDQPLAAASQTPQPLDAATWRRLESWAARSHPRLLTEMVRLYLHETPKKIAQIRQAAQEADTPRLHQTAQALQMASAAVGAQGVVHLAQRLAQIDPGPTEDDGAAWLASLEEEFARVRAALAQLAGVSS